MFEPGAIGAILLAAGESSRLGAPKQLLRFRGETFLRRSAQTALAVADRTVVTLGARAEVLRREIGDLPVIITENENWKAGMGGSLKAGLEKLLANPSEISVALVMVCDQPLVDAVLLEKLIAACAESDFLIAACEYGGTRGVPAVFRRALFPEMLRLERAGGAQRLIEKYRAQTVAVPFPGGAFDVDTPDDYENLTANFK